MEPPELYVRQNPVPNAYTLAIAGRKPFIVVHTALLELLTPAELQAVLAHELGHLKCDHGLWLTVANVIASGAVSMLPIVSGAVEDALMRWLRAAELTCDRAALLVAQDPKVRAAAASASAAIGGGGGGGRRCTSLRRTPLPPPRPPGTPPCCRAARTSPAPRPSPARHP
jgi:Zn-dependent protease with chaperone function